VLVSASYPWINPCFTDGKRIWVKNCHETDGRRTAILICLIFAQHFKSFFKSITSSQKLSLSFSSSVAAPGGKAPPGKAGAGGSGTDESQFSERELTPEEAEAALEDILPADVLKGLVDSNWKTRLAAVEGFNRAVATAADPAALPSQAMVRVLCKKPGLKDNNFQVLKLRFDAVKGIAAGRKVTR
jgi:hypothetical protein